MVKRSLLVTTMVVLILPALPLATADAAAHTCAGKTVTILGTAGDDIIRGTARADVIDGLTGSDLINGLTGNDTICGGYGADDLRGNAGNDRLYGGLDARTDVGGGFTGMRGDTLRGGSGNDTLVPGIDTRTAAEVHPDRILYDTSTRGIRINLTQGTATGDGTDRVVVNGPVELVTTSFDDTVVGSPYADTINTSDGRDSVSAAGGNDDVTTVMTRDAKTLNGGAGTDDLHVIEGVRAHATLNIATHVFRLDTAKPVVATVPGFETYAFRGFSWRVIGTAGADYVNARGMGLGQPVDMLGFGGDDSLLAGGGNDVYNGGMGTDCIQLFPNPGDNGIDTTTSVETTMVDNPCPWP